MRQKISEQHRVDDEGCPAGGATTGVGIILTWQDGPLDRGENGASVEGVIQAAIGRLQFLQKAGDKSVGRERALAITKLQEALMWLEEPTRQGAP